MTTRPRKPMKILVYLASSINGMISNASNVPDWLSPEYAREFQAVCQQTSAVVMGRTTYGILAPDHLPLRGEGTLIVLTHDTAVAPAQSNVVFTDGTPEEIVGILEARGHDEAVIIGGTQTVSAFLGAGLVDELDLIVEPVLFGAGLPLLRDVDADYPLVLLDVRTLTDHTVRLRYRVLRSADERGPRS